MSNLVADVARTAEWWAGVSFDGAVCETAFMDIDDVAGTLSAAAEALRPGAPFVVSMVNPSSPGNDAVLSSWPPDKGYPAEGFGPPASTIPRASVCAWGPTTGCFPPTSTGCSPPASFWNGSTSPPRPFRPGW